MNIDSLIEGLRKVRPKKVLIQSPLGLRRVVYDVCKILRQQGIEVIISSKPCWGGCDLAISEAMDVSVDAILHIGHGRFLKDVQIPVIYVECSFDDRKVICELVNKAVPMLRPDKRIGIGMTVQLLNFRELVKQILKENGFEVLYGQGHDRLLPAQVIGCDYSLMKKVEMDVDKFFIMGSIFHALGLALITEKRVVAADPETMTVKELSGMTRNVLAKRYANIEIFRRAKAVGVLLCTKPGQKREGLAMEILSLLRSSGKEAYVVIVDEIDERNLLDLPFDAYVNTACPRVSIDEQERFSRPILLPSEAMVALGLISWEDLIMNGEYLNPYALKTKG